MDHIGLECRVNGSFHGRTGMTVGGNGVVGVSGEFSLSHLDGYQSTVILGWVGRRNRGL